MAWMMFVISHLVIIVFPSKIRVGAGGKMRRLLIFCLILLFYLGLAAQTIHFKGFTQMWFSYADTQVDDSSTYGFTLKRVHFMPYGNFGKKINWMIHVGYEGHPGLKLLDAFLEYNLSKKFRIKLGQFPAPGAPFRVTPKLDFVQRAPITQTWGGMNSLFGWRALGIQAHGNIMNGKLYYAVMLANPRTLGGFFTPSNNVPIFTNTAEGINLWARLEAKPIKGLKAGAFLGTGEQTDINEDTSFSTQSYGLHVEYRHQKGLYVKSEYISGEKGSTKYSGMYATLGYKIKKLEPIIRYDYCTPNDGNPDDLGVEKYTNITLGLNYYLNPNVKFQANYVARSEEGTDLKNNIFYIHFQYFFNSK
jgi:hypothetical protein